MSAQNVELGRKCEKVAAYLVGIILNPDSDWFNDVCDGIVIADNTTAEVKGQRPWLRSIWGCTAFTMEESQIAKCVNVGHLYFVNVPEIGDNVVRVYEATTRNFKRYILPGSTKKMIAFLDFVEIHNTGEAPELAVELRRLSNAFKD